LRLALETPQPTLSECAGSPPLISSPAAAVGIWMTVLTLAMEQEIVDSLQTRWLRFVASEGEH
jgi:hypothetical protein